MAVFVASNGRVYTPSEVVERLQDGTWRPCVSDVDDGRELVETADGSLLLLVPYRTLDHKEKLRERRDVV